MGRVACSGAETQRKAADGRNVTALSIRLILAVLLVVGGHGWAGAQGRASWQVVEISGNADVVVSGAQPVALSRSAGLAGGEQVRTGPDGRVVLRRGEDTLVVAPNSAIVLPATAEGAVTRVLQLLGSLIVRVEQRKDGAFEVRTPFLVAVVKGTFFSVSVDAAGSRVHVVEGRVEVTELANRATLSLGPGQAVGVILGRPFAIEPSAAPGRATPALDRVMRDIATGSAGLLMIEGAVTTATDVMSGGGVESIVAPPSPPAAAVLHGLGGNRTRTGAPPGASVPAVPSAASGTSPPGGGGQGQR